MLQHIFLKSINRLGLRFSRGLLAGTMLILLFTSISCIKSERVAERDRSSSQHTSSGEQEDIAATAVAKRSDRSRSTDTVTFVEQGIERLSSPFTKHTVLKLNGIVSRSLAAIERFDALQRQASIDQNVGVRLNGYDAVAKDAWKARIDLALAAKELRESGEKHNPAILAAMIRFADNVSDEIDEEIGFLKAGQHVAASE